MTLKQIQRLDREFLTVAEVAEFMRVAPQGIRTQARVNPAALGFPVSMIGVRVLIPRMGFIKFCKGESA